MHEISSGEMSILFEDDELKQGLVCPCKGRKGSKSLAERINFKSAATSHIHGVHTTFSVCYTVGLPPPHCK